MKENVHYSAYCWFITIVIIAFCTVLSCIWINNGKLAGAVTLISVLIILLAMAMFYAPLSVKVTYRYVIVKRLLHNRRLAISEIDSVVLCPSTMGAVRICGSGGWFGYWGWFKERDLGKYYAYYGRSSDCFLIILKDGRRYVIGCDNSADVIDFILRRLSDR